MGLVCFRLKGSNELNRTLLSNINASGKLHMVPSAVHGRYVIRFCVCAQDAKDSDIDYAWDVITDFAAELLEAEMVKEKSGVPESVLESSNQEVGQLEHKLEMSELLELMERVIIPVHKDAPATKQGADSSSHSAPESHDVPVVPVVHKIKQKVSKQLSKRQFSFTDTIEFVDSNPKEENTANP